MNKTARKKIVIIGCGNVAWHLAKHFYSKKRFSVYIYNHQPNTGLKEFASQLNCKTEVGLDNIIDDADYYMICVSDKFISTVSKKIVCRKPAAMILHSSGSAEISEIKNKNKNRGVFYPLQTFSKGDVLHWKEIPLLLEASNSITKSALGVFAKQFSDKTYFLSYKRRLRFHLAAVMVNNFTNALYVAASELTATKQKDVDFKLLFPLIKQTTVKMERLNPIAAQTGPAKRKDLKVMDKHLAVISKMNGLKKVYRDLSELILKQQSHA